LQGVAEIPVARDDGGDLRRSVLGAAGPALVAANARVVGSRVAAAALGAGFSARPAVARVIRERRARNRQQGGKKDYRRDP
jgi:hypothetical protein